MIADLLKIALGTMFNEINKLNCANEKKFTYQIDSLNKEIASLKQSKAMHPTQPFSTTFASVIKENNQQNVDTRHILLNLVSENARNRHDREANVIVVGVKDQPGSNSKESDKKNVSNFFKSLGLETIIVMERRSLIRRSR